MKRLMIALSALCAVASTPSAWACDAICQGNRNTWNQLTWRTVAGSRRMNGPRHRLKLGAEAKGATDGLRDLRSPAT